MSCSYLSIFNQSGIFDTQMIITIFIYPLMQAKQINFTDCSCVIMVGYNATLIYFYANGYTAVGMIILTYVQTTLTNFKYRLKYAIKCFSLFIIIFYHERNSILKFFTNIYQ